MIFHCTLFVSKHKSQLMHSGSFLNFKKYPSFHLIFYLRVQFTLGYVHVCAE